MDDGITPSGVFNSSLPNGDPRLLVLGLALLRLEGVGRDLLVVLLEGSEILAGLGELAFLHTLAHVPVDEGPLAVHEIELVVQTGPGLGDGGRVGQHGDGPVDGGETAVVRGRGGNHHRLLVVDAELETGRAPLYQVERGLGLQSRNGGVAVAGNDISAVEQGDSHVLAIPGITDHHLVVGLEACVLVSSCA